MLANPDDQLQALARDIAKTLTRPDKKQLRFNDIISTAKLFYPCDIDGGVVELVVACDLSNRQWGPDFIGPMQPNPLYTTRKDPMWWHLRDNFMWMVEDTPEFDAALTQMLGQTKKYEVLVDESAHASYVDDNEAIGGTTCHQKRCTIWQFVCIQFAQMVILWRGWTSKPKG